MSVTSLNHVFFQKFLSLWHSRPRSRILVTLVLSQISRDEISLRSSLYSALCISFWHGVCAPLPPWLSVTGAMLPKWCKGHLWSHSLHSLSDVLCRIILNTAIRSLHTRLCRNGIISEQRSVTHLDVYVNNPIVAAKLSNIKASLTFDTVNSFSFRLWHGLEFHASVQVYLSRSNSCSWFSIAA